MEEYETKSKVTELQEEKRSNEQASCKVTSGYAPWVGTYPSAAPGKATTGPFLLPSNFLI